MKKIKFLTALILVSLLIFVCSCTQILEPQAQTCTVHKDLNRDSICDTCGKEIPINCTSHADNNHDGKCDTNGCKVEMAVFHTDANHDGRCDASACTQTFEVVHSDSNNDGKCDTCGAAVEKMPCAECADLNADGICDTCGNTMKKDPCDACVDENRDGKCDVCGSVVDTKCECADANYDGKCDFCKSDMEGALVFVNGGKTDFAFVLASGSGSSNVKAVKNLIKELKELGVNVRELEDSADTVTEYEVLFGSVATRGEEYEYDMHRLGKKGYAIRVIGNKIHVTAGSEEGLANAIEIFRSEYLGITDDIKTLGNRVVYESQSVVRIQDDYDVTSVSVEGEDIDGYTIAVNKNHPASVKVAKAVQNSFYEYTGYWLPIVDISEAGKSVVIEMLQRSGNEGLYISVKAGEIRISCEYEGKLEEEVMLFFDRNLRIVRGDLNFTAPEHNKVKNIRDIYYSQFGAVGDGKTDDFAAIIATHKYANKEGHTVVADRGARYYIGNNGGEGHFESAVVMTDTYLGDATFIIDDSEIAPDFQKNGIFARECAVFSVEPSIPEAIMGTNPNGILKSATNIGFAPGYKAVVVILDTSKRNYIRYGQNADAGQFQCETVLVDKDGNIEPSTSLMWDYEKISYCRVYYAEDEPITISGGKFITRYNQAPGDYTPYSRSITVTRSNVTVKNMTHRYEGYGESGGPSGGIVLVRNCYNTTIDNIEVESPKMFYETGADGKPVGMGSYEFSARFAVNTTWQNCNQINFYDETGIYARAAGMMGTNHCKNMFYINNRLSSFDSHSGAQNITIRGCEIEHINCIGAGNVIIEDTVIHAMHQGCAIILRGDYGSLWMGDVYFKNVTLKTRAKTSIALFQASWPGPNHYFGFRSTMPTNVYVDNIIIDSEVGLNSILLSNGSSQLNAGWKYWEEVVVNPATNEKIQNLNPYKLTEKLYIKNCSGYKFWMPAEFTTEVIYLD